MKPSHLFRVTFLAMLIVVVAIPALAQRVQVESNKIAADGSGVVADRGATVSRAGVSFEFVSTSDEGFVTYEYRDLEQLEVGDVVKIHSAKFVPKSATNEVRKLEPGDDQWAVITVKSIEKNGKRIKVGLEEPVQVYNRSVRAQGQRGHAPAPQAQFTESLMFISRDDGSWRLVSSPKIGEKKSAEGKRKHS